MCVHNRRGRYTGSVNLNVDDRRHPTDDAVRFLAHLRVMLGELTDLGTPPPLVVPEAEKVTVGLCGQRRHRDIRPVPDELVGQVRGMAAADALPSWFWWRSSSVTSGWSRRNGSATRSPSARRPPTCPTA